MNGDIRASGEQLESTAQRNGVKKMTIVLLELLVLIYHMSSILKEKMEQLLKTEDEAELQDEEDIEVDDKSFPWVRNSAVSFEY